MVEPALALAVAVQVVVVAYPLPVDAGLELGVGLGAGRRYVGVEAEVVLVDGDMVLWYAFLSGKGLAWGDTTVDTVVRGLPPRRIAVGIRSRSDVQEPAAPSFSYLSISKSLP